MNDAAAALLGQWGFAFALVLCRTGAAVMLLPGFGEDEPPAMLKAGLALTLAVLLTPLLGSDMPAMPTNIAPLLGMILLELVVGGLLGWLARLVALALPMAGQVISVMTGLSSVLQPDLTFGAQSAVLGRLLALAAPVVILSSGLYAGPLLALAGSFHAIPPASGLASGDAVQVAIRAVGASIALALQLAAPFLLASTLWQVGLGLASRLVPQLQIFFAALPGQIFGGLVLLGLVAVALIDGWAEAVRAGFGLLPGS